MSSPGMTGRRDRSVGYHQGIRIDKIPVEGAPGLLFVAATLLIFLTIPAVREFLIITSILGGVGAGILYFWHNQTRW